MTRSILPPCLRRESATGSSLAKPGRSRFSLPPTPPIDRCDARGVSLVELARVAEETDA